jgi:hypothetical protein
MTEVTMIGLDLAKNVFQVHGMRPDGSVAFRVKLARIKVLAFFAAQPICIVAMEACASAHYWGRENQQPDGAHQSACNRYGPDPRITIRARGV